MQSIKQGMYTCVCTYECINVLEYFNLQTCVLMRLSNEPQDLVANTYLHDANVQIPIIFHRVVYIHTYIYNIYIYIYIYCMHL